MNIRKYLILPLLVVGFSNIDTKFVYHPGYNFDQGGNLVNSMLTVSKYTFNPLRKVAEKFGYEEAFIQNGILRAYIDVMRPQHIRDILLQHPAISEKLFHKPAGEISEEELLKIHDPEYLKMLFNDPQVIASIVEMSDLASLSFWPFSYDMEFFRKAALRPILLASQGTLDAVDIALQKREKGEFGWAINLGGGYHHAKRGGNPGEDYSKWGNCPISDEGLATLKALQEYKLKKVLVVDLDAHQGNGNAWTLRDNESVAIFDMYNSEASGHYPPDQKEAAQCIRYNYPLKRYTGDVEYLAKLKACLPKAIEAEQPELIIYNAGSDPLENDPEGLLALSAEGIKERDQFVFEQAKKCGAALVMAPSGGYTQESAAVVAESIKNLFDKEIIS